MVAVYPSTRVPPLRSTYPENKRRQKHAPRLEHRVRDRRTNCIVRSSPPAGLALHDGRPAHTGEHEYGGGAREGLRVLHDLGDGLRPHRLRRRNRLPEVVQRLVARRMEEGE